MISAVFEDVNHCGSRNQGREKVDNRNGKHEGNNDTGEEYFTSIFLPQVHHF